MKEITKMDEIALLKEWCKQMKSGTIDNLSAAITEVFGHCENTTKHRINALTGSRVIIVYNNSWKYNPSYNNQGVELMKRLKEGLKSEDEK